MKNANGEMLHEFFKALYGAWRSVEDVEESIHMESGMSKAQKINLAHLISAGPMTVSDLAYVRGVSGNRCRWGLPPWLSRAMSGSLIIHGIKRRSWWKLHPMAGSFMNFLKNGKMK